MLWVQRPWLARQQLLWLQLLGHPAMLLLLLLMLPQLLQVEAAADVRHHLGANLARSKALCSLR